MRVAVDLRALVGRRSGIGYATEALLTGLARRREHRFLGLSHRPVARAAALRDLGIEVEASAVPLGVAWQQLRLPRRLARGDVDLFWSPLLTLPGGLSLPSVVTVWDLTPVLFPEMHRLKNRLSILPFLERSLEEASRVVVAASSTADDLAFHFPATRGKIGVVPLAADPVFEPADATEVRRTRQEIGCPEGYVLHVGTLEPRKNLGALLDAWELLRRDGSLDLPLVVVGPYGWHSRHLLDRMGRLEALGLRYLGHQPRETLVRITQGASLFVCPSLYEGFGLPALEAMACGVPVVATRTSSLTEVVGTGGRLVEPDNPAELARELEEIASSPSLAAELGARALERSRAFSWPAAAGGMEEQFRGALEA